MLRALLAAILLALLCACPGLAAAHHGHDRRVARHRHRHAGRHHRATARPGPGPTIVPTPFCHSDTERPGLAPPDSFVTATAQADAHQLMNGEPMLSGVTPVASDPAGTSLTSVPPIPCAYTPDQMGYHAFFTTREGVAQALAGLATPPGALESGAGPFLGSDAEFVIMSFPDIPGVDYLRQVIISAVPLAGGGSALRVDSAVLETNPRPLSEVVPAGVSSVTLTVAEPANSDVAAPQPMTTSDPTTVAQLVGIVDGLPAAQSGVACDLLLTPTYTLTFTASDGATLAQISQDSACGDTMTIHGVDQDALDSFDPSEVGAIFGLPAPG